MSEQPLNKLVAELLLQAKAMYVSYATSDNIGEICARSLALESQLTAAQSRVASLEYENQRLIELVRSYEPDRERLEFYERELDEIGRSLGCDHKDDGYLRCVTSTIEDAQSRVVELEQLLGASLDMMNRMLPRNEAESKECQLIKAEMRKALDQ